MRKRKIVFAIAGPAPHVLGYVVAPLLIARRVKRHGWRDGRPGAINLLGLLPISAGAGMLGWAIASHYDAAPDAAPLTVVPTYLACGGAYRVTRNPMYVGGAAMQVGWAMFFGSIRNVLVVSLYLAGLSSFGVPFEERLLHARFGDSYDAYRRTVPRWLPTRRAGARFEPRAWVEVQHRLCAAEAPPPSWSSCGVRPDAARLVASEPSAAQRQRPVDDALD